MGWGQRRTDGADPVVPVLQRCAGASARGGGAGWCGSCCAGRGFGGGGCGGFGGGEEGRCDGCAGLALVVVFTVYM